MNTSSLADQGSSPTVQAASWILVDEASKRVLLERNADAERQPASLTKLMTAYVVLDALQTGKIQLDERVLVGEHDVNALKDDESRMYLFPGQTIRVRHLLEGLVAASANDAALVLAKLVGGSTEGFVRLMNAKAIQIGMQHTHFATPSGITTVGNYTTARDLSILSQRLTLNYPEYYKYSAIQNFSYGRFKKKNKNRLLGVDPSVDGLKTGHTEAAGYCIAATAKRYLSGYSNPQRLFVVVLGAPTEQDRIADARALLDFGFLQVATRPPLKSGSF